METSESWIVAQDLNQQGMSLLKAGNLEAAKEKFDQAIDMEPMLMDSYKNCGDFYLIRGEYQEAKNYYKKALLIEKKGEVYFQYGNACFMNDNPHEGLEYYNLALSAGYDQDDMFFFMGMAYEHMNDDNMALRYIQKAIIKNPSRSDYKVKKISILMRMGMQEETEGAIQELILNDPELYDGYHLKTTYLLQIKNYDEAVSFAKASSEKFPEDADLLFDYVQALSLAGNYDEALKSIGHAKRLQYFEAAKAKFTLLEAEILAEKEDLESAIGRCKECIALEGVDEFYIDARFMLINLYIAMQDYENALTQTTELIDHNGQDSYYFAAIYFRPFCLRKLGQEEEATQYYQKAVSLYRLATVKNPDAFDAYLYRAMCFRDMEKYEEALDVLDFMEKLSDRIAEVYTIRADIYKMMGKLSLMKEELEKVYQLKPELKAALQEGGES